MTDQELQAIKDQIKAELMEEMATSRSDKHGAQMMLADTRRKYISNSWGGRIGKEPTPMRTAFLGDGVKVARIWEVVRQLTCWIMDKSYVRDLPDEKLANEIAATLCECIIECRAKYNNRFIKADKEGGK